MARNGVKAAIDLSDGLISDLTHLCRSSQVGAKIFAYNLPIHPTVLDCFPEEAVSLALSGGEDYELLFTATGEIIKKTRQQINIPVTIIGEITGEVPGKPIVLDKDGYEITTSNGGWEHFGHRS